MGISEATRLFKYHYISVFARTKQTTLAGCLHSTQDHMEVLGSTGRSSVLGGLVDESELFCFLHDPGVQPEGLHLAWTDSFHLTPG